MSPGPIVGNLACIKQFDEGRPTHAEKVGGFLSREALVHRSDYDGLPLRHGVDHAPQHLEDLRRQNDTFAFGPYQRGRALVEKPFSRRGEFR